MISFCFGTYGFVPLTAEPMSFINYTCESGLVRRGIILQAPINRRSIYVGALANNQVTSRCAITICSNFSLAQERTRGSSLSFSTSPSGHSHLEEQVVGSHGSGQQPLGERVVWPQGDGNEFFELILAFSVGRSLQS